MEWPPFPEPERIGLVDVTFSPKERPQHGYLTLHGGISI